MSVYKKNIIVAQNECDLYNDITIGSILRQVQEVSTEQCKTLGIPYEHLYSFNAAFLLAKVSVEVYGKIQLGDKITVKTQPAAPERATYKRVTTLYAENGEMLASVDARWVLVDTQARRILRRPPEGLVLPFIDDVKEEHDNFIVRAETTEETESIKARYSIVDRNYHINNAKYADIICDMLPDEFWHSKNKIEKAVIYYRNELSFGDSMCLSLGECIYKEKSAYYFCGNTNSGRCFEANIIYNSKN